MSTKKYGVALIGCGCMGEAHMEHIYYKDYLSMEYVCDLDKERAEKFQKKFNVKKTDLDWKRVVADENVDIVIISTPPSLHFEILKECIRLKKHVLCEKPICDTMEDAKKAVKLIKEHPECKVLVGYILRHNKTYQKVAEMIHAGAIGKPIIMRMSQNHHTMDWPKYLNLIRETSPIIDCGVHYFDVMRWFTGAEIESFSGIGLRTEMDVPEGNYNYGLVTIKMSDGSVGYYEAGWSNTITADNLKEFVGPKGRIRIFYQDNRHEHREEGDLIEYYTYPEKKYEMINLECKRKPTDDQLDELINMIENNVVGSPSIDDVFKSFSVAVEADKLIKKGL